MKRLCTVGIVVLFVVVVASVRADADASASRAYFDSVKKYVQDGQYNLAREAAENWVALSDTDAVLMSEACALLSNHKLHGTAVVLMERLDWIMPQDSLWPNDTLNFMQKRGLDKAVDAVLTYGTALVAGTDIRKPCPDPFGRYRTAVYPIAAQRLFYFRESDEDQIELLYERYERQVRKRPDDVGLLSEYAYWLAWNKQNDKAVKMANRIDLEMLDVLTLKDLGTMWSGDANTNLVRFTITPLEQALTRGLTDREAARYTGGGQALFMPPYARQLFHEQLLTELAGRYAYLGRYEDAKIKYEEYLALPRRERWGDRTRYLREYADVLKKMGLPDPNRIELETKAKQSGEGKDWAELAAYLQGLNEIAQAKDAWETAIELTPLVPRGFKVERPRAGYQKQLIKMLDDNRMYEEELPILKEAFAEETHVYSKNQFLVAIAQAYFQLDEKDEAMAFLYEQLDQDFKMTTVDLILRVDHEKTLFDYYSLNHRELENLSSWNVILKKMEELPHPQKNEALIEFFDTYAMYPEYVDLVEQLPADKLNYSKMNRLSDYSSRCDRYNRSVYWGKEILKRVGTEGYPAEGGREHINTLEDVSQFAAKAGDYQTSLEYAKKLCLIVPERYYFARSLAEVATTDGKKDELIDELKMLAQQHPGRWVIWKVLADVYDVFGRQSEREECLREVERLQ